MKSKYISEENNKLFINSYLLEGMLNVEDIYAFNQKYFQPKISFDSIQYFQILRHQLIFNYRLN